MHCNPTIISHSMYSPVDCSYWQSHHVLLWHFQAPEDDSFLTYHTNAQASQSSNKCCQPQFPSPATDLFQLDITTDVTLVTVPYICQLSNHPCPNNELPFRVTCHFNTETAGRAQNFNKCHIACWMLTASLCSSVHLMRKRPDLLCFSP